VARFDWQQNVLLVRVGGGVGVANPVAIVTNAGLSTSFTGRLESFNLITISILLQFQSYYGFNLTTVSVLLRF